jgi:hypothetical protein
MNERNIHRQPNDHDPTTRVWRGVWLEVRCGPAGGNAGRAVAATPSPPEDAPYAGSSPRGVHRLLAPRHAGCTGRWLLAVRGAPACPCRLAAHVLRLVAALGFGQRWGLRRRYGSCRGRRQEAGDRNGIGTNGQGQNSYFYTWIPRVRWVEPLSPNRFHPK